MQQINITGASKHLLKLVEAAISGEEILIVKDDQSVVKLTPVSRVKRHPLFGSAKDLITISDDFDEPYN